LSTRDATEDALRDAAHDAFRAFWYAAEPEQATLWDAYCAAQARYDAYLMRKEHAPPSRPSGLASRPMNNSSRCSTVFQVTGL